MFLYNIHCVYLITVGVAHKSKVQYKELYYIEMCRKGHNKYATDKSRCTRTSKVDKTKPNVPYKHTYMPIMCRAV